MKKTTTMTILSLLVLIVVPPNIMAQEQPTTPNPNEDFSIVGAGATFPFPLIDLWRVEYQKEYPNVKLNYQSIGSGGGIKQHIERTVNFAATDAPMKASETEQAPGTLHIPEAIGGVVVAYNIPEIPDKGLRLTGQVMADIFLGEITKWNDPQIAEHNPDLDLPDEDIVPARRSDGSGTTFVFTDYLTQVSPGFDAEIGKGKSVPWPVGVAAAGNEGVAGIVRSTPYSVGYVELAYAFQTDMSYAYVQNADQTAFIEPTLDSISAASQGVSDDLPSPDGDWSQVTLVNAPGPDSYPIASFTYLLVYEDLEQATDSMAEAQAVIHMINWMITEGQALSPDLLYVPLSESVTMLGQEGLQMVKYNGQQVWGSAVAMDESGQEGGGCLIATAAFGSELAPQVQTLREIRDGTLASTASGSAFMAGFNSIYYLFSPAVADVQRDNAIVNDIVRTLVTPMIATLGIMELAEPGSETDVLALGVGIIGLNLGMYIAGPASLVYLIKRKLR